MEEGFLGGANCGGRRGHEAPAPGAPRQYVDTAPSWPYTMQKGERSSRGSLVVKLRVTPFLFYEISLTRTILLQ